MDRPTCRALQRNITTSCTYRQETPLNQGRRRRALGASFPSLLASPTITSRPAPTHSRSTHRARTALCLVPHFPSTLAYNRLFHRPLPVSHGHQSIARHGGRRPRQGHHLHYRCVTRLPTHRARHFPQDGEGLSSSPITCGYHTNPLQWHVSPPWRTGLHFPLHAVACPRSRRVVLRTSTSILPHLFFAQPLPHSAALPPTPRQRYVQESSHGAAQQQ